MALKGNVENLNEQSEDINTIEKCAICEKTVITTKNVILIPGREFMVRHVCDCGNTWVETYLIAEDKTIQPSYLWDDCIGPFLCPCCEFETNNIDLMNKHMEELHFERGQPAYLIKDGTFNPVSEMGVLKW